jgi:hypothetical protein
VQVQRQFLLAELLHQPGFLFDQDHLAAEDHADAVGHFFGFFDVVRGQDDRRALLA